MIYICKQILTYMRQSTEIRQEQIKRAVLDIIYADGLKNVSTKNLAEHIGISEGTIYRHFASKQEINLSILIDVQYDFIEPLRAIANSTDEPEKRLFNFLCKTVSYLTENKGITMLMFSEASHNNNSILKNKLFEIFNLQKSLVSKIILDGIALGIWDERIAVENVAMIYMGIPVSLNIELILSSGEFHAGNFCQRMMLLLMKILIK